MYQEIIKRIKEHYPEPRIEINYSNPFELLVGLMLSARCRDDVANRVAAALFDRFPTPDKLAAADVDEINRIISACSMHNTKAKNLKKMAEVLCFRHGCKVPDKFEDLVALPGVARKTANMVLSFGFGIPAVGVDTHVARVAKRLGISHSDKPEEVEEAIKTICPKEDWITFYSGLILFGRYICKARKPLCDKCFLRDLCGEAGGKQ